MCVADRIMDGDVRATYDPMNHVLEEEDKSQINFPGDLGSVQKKHKNLGKYNKAVNAGIRNAPDEVQNMVSNSTRDLWLELVDTTEHVRLTTALMELKLKQKNARNKSSNTRNN